MINFTKHKDIYLIVSGLLALAGLLAFIIFGLNFGIELAGGTSIEMEYEDRPPAEEVRNDLVKAGIADVQVQEIGESGLLIRTTQAGEELYNKVTDTLERGEEKYFESIGPAVGKELRNSTIIAMVVASLLVIIYIAFAFSGASGPLASWQYGTIAAVVAFFHDVLIIIGVFAVLGQFWGVQFTIPITVALLTTLGYSLNDTVVIFDRIRENIGRLQGSFQEIVNRSLNQILTRSINTSLTTLFVLLAILFFGGETLFYFVLALSLGILLGTYSSIFLASSLLLAWKDGFDDII